MTFDRTLTWLSIADLLAVAAFGLILPIFALFLFDNIPDATIQGVAMAQALFLGSKAIFDLLFSTYDAHHPPPPKKAAHRVALGYLVMAAIPLGYAGAHGMDDIFLLQMALGLGVGLVGTAWHDLFTASTDQRWHGSEFTAYRTAAGFACAATAIMGGIVAQLFGYQILLMALSALPAAASIMTLFVAFNAIEPAAKPRSSRGRRTAKRAVRASR
jgi:hypothetical protein